MLRFDMTPEGKIEKYFKKRVEETGGRTRKLKWIEHNGAPDRIAWWPCTGPIFVELKKPGKEPTKRQKEEHRLMREDGLVVYVLDSKMKIDSFVLLWAL